jgi:hypothetical protein
MATSKAYALSLQRFLLVSEYCRLFAAILWSSNSQL